jgi:hypothetical protein
MYCNQCGNQIPDNSVFCSFCGHKLNSIISNSPKTNMVEFVLPVSKGNLILYLSWWSLAALFCLIYIWVDNESILPALFVLPVYVGVPLVVYTIYRTKNKKQDKSPKTLKGEPQSLSSDTSCKVSDEMPLLEFAREFGKMQVCKTANKEGQIRSQCLFTKVTEVHFSDSIGELTASEISANKENLVVRRIADCKYELILASGAMLNSVLPPPIDKISE